MSELRPIDSMSHRQVYEELRARVGSGIADLPAPTIQRINELIEALFSAAVGDRDADVDTSAALVPHPPRGSHEEEWREAALEEIAGQFFLYTKASRRSCYSFAEAITNAIESRLALYDRDRHYSSKPTDETT